MIQPQMISLLYDESSNQPKVFFRPLLYTTGKRGCIIEGMYLKVRCGESVQTFNYWMEGEAGSTLRIGGGLKVGEDGVVSNHHYVPHVPHMSRTSYPSFQFLSGDYTIEVFARIFNRRHAILLATMKVSLTQEMAAALSENNAVHFAWESDTQGYRGYVDAPKISAVASARLPSRNVLGRITDKVR
jgi:hypothetical protein